MYIDLVFNPWESTEDGQRRTITYIVSLNHALGPKHSATTEKQVTYPQQSSCYVFSAGQQSAKCRGIMLLEACNMRKAFSIQGIAIVLY